MIETKKQILKIASLVCEKYDINLESLKLKTRKRIIVEPRQIIYHIVNAKIGNKVTLQYLDYLIRGKRRHDTVLHSIGVVNNLLATDKQFANRYDEILLELGFNAEVKEPFFVEWLKHLWNEKV